jgi:hypothetical protein
MSADGNDDNSQTVIPSYVAVRVGEVGGKCKLISNFFPADSLLLNRKRFYMKIGDCLFTDTVLKGTVSQAGMNTGRYPAYFNSTGTFCWNLQYEKQIDAGKGLSEKIYNWIPTGMKTVFSGTLTVDGEDFTVSPEKYAGYADKLWGKQYPLPWFHLSSANLVSIISGKRLTHSCFSIEGLYVNTLCAFAYMEGQKLEFVPGQVLHPYTATWECLETPQDSEGKKLHWSASISDNRYVFDIDVFCKTEELFVRDYETVSGGKKLLKVLGGGTGSGEIRFYRYVKKNIELIEHAHISQVICEYGTKE